MKEFVEMVNPLDETYLNGSNFVNWKFKMQTFMEGYGVWTIKKGDEARPNASAGVTLTTIQDWDKQENKAKVLLRMYVKDNITPHIRDAKTSKEISKELKDLYETNNRNHILFLKSKLLSIKMDINESVSTFLRQIKDMKDKLGDI